MKPKYIQVSCAEGDKIDLRQSKAVLRHGPDLIFLEYPGDSLKPITKPRHIHKGIILKHPWTESDNYMWENISKLWKENYRTLVYAVDGPSDLVNKANIYECNDKYPNKTSSLFWWVRIYLRECYMANKIKIILNQYKDKKNPTILIFLQSFHWKHVKFLLSNPSKYSIWKFYFGRFKKLNNKNIRIFINAENKILSRHWNSSINFLK